MPYKNKALSFGERDESAKLIQFKEDIEVLIFLLDLNRCITGVKLINSEDEYIKIDAPEAKGKMAYCQMILKATKGSNIQKSKLENHSCDGGTTALGLEASCPKIENGDEYFSYNLYETKAAARRMRSKIESISYDENKTYGILSGSADEFEVIPDVLILITNSYQAMRLVQGYEFKTGIKPTIDLGAMQAICSELTTVPLMNGTMNLSVLCPSTRMLCQWDESEMGVSIPYDQLSSVVEGVIGTMNTTDNKKKKERIKHRFLDAGREIDIDTSIGYK